MNSEDLRKYMSELGRRGGRSKSQKKIEAVKQTLKKANAKRLRRRMPSANSAK